MTQQTVTVLSDYSKRIPGDTKTKIKYQVLKSNVILMTITDDRDNFVYDCLLGKDGGTPTQ